MRSLTTHPLIQVIPGLVATIHSAVSCRRAARVACSCRSPQISPEASGPLQEQECRTYLAEVQQGYNQGVLISGHPPSLQTPEVQQPKVSHGMRLCAAVPHADIGQPDDTNLLGQQNNRCWNVQWLLLILGVFFHIPSIVASFLPLCRVPRFPNKSYRWVALIMVHYVV